MPPTAGNLGPCVFNVFIGRASKRCPCGRALLLSEGPLLRNPCFGLCSGLFFISKPLSENPSLHKKCRGARMTQPFILAELRERVKRQSTPQPETGKAGEAEKAAERFDQMAIRNHVTFV